MAFPVNVATRLVSFGGAVSVEAGTPLLVRVETKSNRSLIKAVSGYRLESLTHTLDSNAGQELEFPLPVTDQNGWIDALTRQAIVVDTDQHSHLYTSKVTIFDGNVRVAEYIYENYPVPSGASVLDGDTMLLDDPAQPGVLVAVPETWSGWTEEEIIALIEEHGGAGGVSSWNDLTDKPTTFPPSTHTHAWDTITSKPTTFPPSTHAHAWSEVTGKPTTFDPSAHMHLWADITDKPTTFAPATHSHAWADITGKPTTFTPSTHSHAISDTTGLQAALDLAAKGTRREYISGAWEARGTTPGMRDWSSTKDPAAPPPTEMVIGDTWTQHPDAVTG